MYTLKNIAAVVIAAGLSTGIHAQEFSKGEKIVGGGLGFGSYGGFSVGGSFEHGFKEDIVDNLNLSLGAFASFTTYDYLSNYNVTRTFIGGQANLNYYEESFGQFQPYIGLTIGYDIVSTSYSGIGALGGGITGGAQVGTRYYFNDNMAANLRLGWPISVIGLDIKL